MKVYTYDKNTFEYLYEDEAQIDPLETILSGKEVYLIPANSTTITPNIYEDNTVNIFNKNEQRWDAIKDFRGRTAYNIKTGDEFLITELGEVPIGYALEKSFNLQLTKINAIKEINKIYEKSYENTIRIKKVEVSINKRNELLDAYKGLDEDHNEYFFNTEKECIKLSKEDIKIITDKLYERSIELPALKNELIKKIKSSRSQTSISKIIKEAEERFS